MQGDFDNKGAADVRGAHEADHTAGDADQRQGGLIHRTSGRAHWKQDISKTHSGKNLGSRRPVWPSAAQPSQQGRQWANLVQAKNVSAHNPNELHPHGMPCCQPESEGLSILMALGVNNNQLCASSPNFSWDRFTKKS